MRKNMDILAIVRTIRAMGARGQMRVCRGDSVEAYGAVRRCHEGPPDSDLLPTLPCPFTFSQARISAFSNHSNGVSSLSAL